MIEKTVRDYLNAVLESPSWMEVPKEPPERYYIIERTGGSVSNHIYHATLAIQSYAQRMEDAAEMNDDVVRAMQDCTLESISVRVDSPGYNFTDTTMKKYRSQAVFDVVHY